MSLCNPRGLISSTQQTLNLVPDNGYKVYDPYSSLIIEVSAGRETKLAEEHEFEEIKLQI